jgi:hypothetical protein
VSDALIALLALAFVYSVGFACGLQWARRCSTRPCSPVSVTPVVQHYHFSTGGGCPITVNASAERVLVNGRDVKAVAP